MVCVGVGVCAACACVYMCVHRVLLTLSHQWCRLIPWSPVCTAFSNKARPHHSLLPPQPPPPPSLPWPLSSSQYTTASPLPFHGPLSWISIEAYTPSLLLLLPPFSSHSPLSFLFWPDNHIFKETVVCSVLLLCVWNLGRWRESVIMIVGCLSLCFCCSLGFAVSEDEEEMWENIVYTNKITTYGSDLMVVSPWIYEESRLK